MKGEKPGIQVEECFNILSVMYFKELSGSIPLPHFSLPHRHTIYGSKQIYWLDKLS